MPKRDRVVLLTKVKYWLRKQTDTQWQWGHSDDWSGAEWYYYNKR